MKMLKKRGRGPSMTVGYNRHETRAGAPKMMGAPRHSAPSMMGSSKGPGHMLKDHPPSLGLKIKR